MTYRMPPTIIGSTQLALHWLINFLGCGNFGCGACMIKLYTSSAEFSLSWLINTVLDINTFSGRNDKSLIYTYFHRILLNQAYTFHFCIFTVQHHLVSEKNDVPRARYIYIIWNGMLKALIAIYNWTKWFSRLTNFKVDCSYSRNWKFIGGVVSIVSL